MLNFQVLKMSGFYVEIQWNLYSVTSKLTLSAVQEHDNGIYSCITSDPDYTSDSIELHVIDGKLDLSIVFI